MIRATNPISFQARVNLKKAGVIIDPKNRPSALHKAACSADTATTAARQLVSSTISGGGAAGLVGASSGVATTGIAVQTAGLASIGAGSAFSSGSAGIIMEQVSPHVTPATVASIEAHPATVGSLLTTIGGSLSGSNGIHIKFPS